MQIDLVEKIIEDTNPSFLDILWDSGKILITGFTSLKTDNKNAAERKSKLFYYPFGFHFTSSNRLARILSDGMVAEDDKHNHFIFLKQDDSDPFTDSKSLRDYAFARWLSYFGIEKSNEDGSLPALFLADLDGLHLERNNRPDELFLQYSERGFTTTSLHPGRILTYANISNPEYVKMKSEYPHVKINMRDYLNGPKPQTNLADQVGAELFRRIGLQCISGNFLNIDNYRKLGSS